MDESLKDDIKEEPSEISEMSSDESTDTISHSPILSPMSISPVGSPVHEVPLPSSDTLQSSQSESSSSSFKQWLETYNIPLESDENIRPSKILKSGKHGIPTPKFPQPTAPVLSTPRARSVLCRIGLTPQGRMVPIPVPPEPVRAAQEPVRAAQEPICAAQEPIRATQEPFRVPLVPIRRRMPLQPVTTPTPRLPVFKKPFPQRFISSPSMRTPKLPAFYTAIPEDNILEEFSVREKKVCDESRKGRPKYTESILLGSDIKNKSKSSAPPKDYTSLGARPKEKTVFTKKKMSPQYTISADSQSFSHFKVRDNSDGSYDRQKKSVNTWFPDHSKDASGKFDDLIIDLTSDCLDKPKPNTKPMDEALKITELCSQISSEVQNIDIVVIKESASASSSRCDTMFKHNLKESEGSCTKIFDIASTSKDDAWFKINLIEPEGLSTSKGRKQSKEMDHAVPSTSRDNTWFKQNIRLSQHLYTEIGQQQQDSAIPSTSKDDAWLKHGGKGSQKWPKQIVCDPVMKDYKTLSTPKDATWLLPTHNLEELELEREPHVFTVAELSSALHDIEHLISAETKATGKMFKGKSKSRVYRKLKTDPDITLSPKKDCTLLADTATKCFEENIEKSIGFVKPAQDIESEFSIREKSTWFKDTAKTPSVKIISVVDVKPTGLKTTVKKDFQIPSTSKGYTSDGTNLPPMMASKKKRKHEESDSPKDDKKDKDYTVKSSEIERKISNRVLEGCTDAEINKLLNFDSLKDAYKFITDIETIKDKKRPRPKKPVAHLPNFPWLPPLDSTNMSHSDIAQLKILMAQADQIFESCWFRNCKFSQPKLGCSQCYLTYCNIHISKMVHGCGFEPFDKPSTVKKIGAAYASAKVKTMGREIERGRLSPASCNCTKLCSKCTFYYAYINKFAPFATAVNETECFLICN